MNMNMNMNMNLSLALADPVLDREHAVLAQLIDDLRHACAGSNVVALDALRAHAREHFAQEDEDLRAMAGGNAKCHIDEHAAVLRSLQEVRDVLTDPQSDGPMQQLLVKRLSSQLLQWLPAHVQEMDAAVATHRAKSRFGGVPVRLPRHTAKINRVCAATGAMDPDRPATTQSGTNV